MVYGLLIVALVLCAFQALRSTRLLVSAIWLAGASALLAVALYGLGAAQVAVMELSIGAGLVTVLFVFAIDIAGDEAIQAHPIVPKLVAGGLVVFSLILLAWMNMPLIGIGIPAPLQSQTEPSFSTMLWQQRGLDVLVQIVLIFAGALGALGLLTDIKPRLATRLAVPVPQSTIAAKETTP